VAKLSTPVTDHQRVAAPCRELQNEFHPLVLPTDSLQTQAEGALVGERFHRQDSAGKGAGLGRRLHGLEEADPTGLRMKLRREGRVPQVEEDLPVLGIQQEGADAAAPEGRVEFPRQGTGQERIPSKAHDRSIPKLGGV
jgi:hypothetical protein